MAQKKKKKARSKPPARTEVTRSKSFDLTPSPLDDLRQLMYPPEFRIERPILLIPERPTDSKAVTKATVESKSPQPESGAKLDQALAEVATCLWYLKTKHFGRNWRDQQCEDDNPRVRRALGRVNKGIDALHQLGVEIEDPTDKRYPPGGEAMMRPLQFTPTEGLTYERVTEAVVPIVFRDDYLIQRAEVFVAVPPPQAVDACDSCSGETTQAAEAELPEQADPTGSEPGDDGAFQTGMPCDEEEGPKGTTSSEHTDDASETDSENVPDNPAKGE